MSLVQLVELIIGLQRLLELIILEIAKRRAADELDAVRAACQMARVAKTREERAAASVALANAFKTK